MDRTADKTSASDTLASATQYLAFERGAEERHEWLDGSIYAMSGESTDHSMINTNLIREFSVQLRGRPCAVYSPNMKTRAQWAESDNRKGLFAYPDAMIVCGKPVFHDKHRDVIVNPKVIVEILSPSTSRYDHEEKFERYRANRSLTDYLLVSQNRPQIQHFTKASDGRWTSVLETRLSKSIAIASIICKLKLADVYDRIEFMSMALVKKPLE